MTGPAPPPSCAMRDRTSCVSIAWRTTAFRVARTAGGVRAGASSPAQSTASSGHARLHRGRHPGRVPTLRRLCRRLPPDRRPDHARRFPGLRAGGEGGSSAAHCAPSRLKPRSDPDRLGAVIALPIPPPMPQAFDHADGGDGGQVGPERSAKAPAGMTQSSGDPRMGRGQLSPRASATRPGLSIAAW